ncbi:MAG TPA: hypothetical protein VKF38_08525 [Anaerolineaceae bacterium]|nr:hypothetical protein [Anaerolineaceae bacterium]
MRAPSARPAPTVTAEGRLLSHGRDWKEGQTPSAPTDRGRHYRPVG